MKVIESGLLILKMPIIKENFIDFFIIFNKFKQKGWGIPRDSERRVLKLLSNKKRIHTPFFYSVYQNRKPLNYTRGNRVIPYLKAILLVDWERVIKIRDLLKKERELVYRVFIKRGYEG